MKISERPLIFYDFETFQEDWLVVFIDYKTRKKCVIINDRDKLIRFYQKYKECIFCGFNNRNYDSTIFKGILAGKNPYLLSNEIVLNNKKQYQLLSKEQRNIQFYNFDCSDKFHSLKQYEGFLGLSVVESDVDFTLNRKLTDEEIQETIRYCTHDVQATIEVFEKSISEFNAMVGLIEMFDLPHDYISKTKAQIGAAILEAEKVERDDEFDLFFPNELQLGRYEFVKEWFLSDESKGEKAKLVFDVYGEEITIGFGGCHLGKKNLQAEGLIYNWDINSMYPATMIEWNTLSRNVKNREKFREIRDTRLKYKAEKNPLQQPLKICINSIFGAAGDKYNNLYDARNKKLTCIYGQLFILDLLDKIENYFGDTISICQVNTDGLMFQLTNKEQLKDFNLIIDEWSKRSKYTMEQDDILKIVQKDVNNYCIEIESHGKVKQKCKGAMVKFNSPLDNDLSIVNDAVRSYLLDGIAPEETINSCNELIKFQKIYKVTGNYRCAYHNNKELKHKIYRVFASKNEENTAIYKWKKDKDHPDLFGGSPEHCFIDNEDIRNKEIPEELDRQWYIDLAWDRINQFLGNKKKRK